MLTAPSNSPNSARLTRRDERLGFLRQPLVAGQRLRPPFRHLAGVVLDPGTRHTDRLRPEGAGELPFAVPVAIAFRGAVAPAVAKPSEEVGQLLLEQGLDRRTDVGPQPLLDRVELGLPGQ